MATEIFFELSTKGAQFRVKADTITDAVDAYSRLKSEIRCQQDFDKMANPNAKDEPEREPMNFRYGGILRQMFREEMSP